MFLGVSFALILACAVLGARLFRLESFWERVFGASLFAVTIPILLSLTVGLAHGGYRPRPLLIGCCAFLVLLLIALAIQKRRLLPIMPRDDRERPYIKAFVLVVILTTPIWAWEFMNGLLLPPTYWDELYYHLVAPAIWARDGQIHFFATTNPFVAGYPANLDLLPGWTMVMTKTDIWADLLGLPFVLTGLALIFAFCRRLKVRPAHAVWSGLLFAATPLVIFHAKSAYIDLPVSVIYGVGAYLLLLYAERGQGKYLFLGGLAMGILVGSKYSGLYLALIGLLPIFYRLRLFRRRGSWLRPILLYAGPILLLGAFFYFRNLILFANPLHPMKLSLGGLTIFNGRYASDAFTFTRPENTWLTLGKALLETQPRPEMDSYYAGFGPQLLLLGFPAALLFLRREPRQRTLMLMAWFIPLFLSIAFLPAKYPRYLIHLPLFILPFVAWLLDRLPARGGRAIKLVALTCLVYGVIIASPIYEIQPQHYDIAASSPWTVGRIGTGAQYAYIDSLNSKRGGALRIVTGPLRLTYPLLGRDWRNELLCIPVRDESQWLHDIQAARADLYTTDSTGETSPEQIWATRHPEILRPVFDDTVVAVYLILSGDESHQAFVRRVLKEGIW